MTLRVSAQNVANVRTSGFKGQRAVAIERAPSGVLTALGTPAIPGGQEPLAVEVTHPAQGPKATEQIELNVNLDPTIGAGDEAEAHASDLETELSVFDSLGNGRRVTFSFHREAGGKWTWTAVVAGDQLQGSDDTGDVIIGKGTVGFSADGVLETESNSTLKVQFNGASPQEIQVDFGDSLETDGGTGQGSTGYVGGSRVKAVSRDGHMATPEVRVFEETLGEASNVDPLTETMNRIEALGAYQANMAVAHTADEMTETVLDLLA